MTDTPSQKQFKVFMAYLIPFRSRLWAILQAATRGQARCLGFTFGSFHVIHLYIEFCLRLIISYVSSQVKDFCFPLCFVPCGMSSSSFMNLWMFRLSGQTVHGRRCCFCGREGKKKSFSSEEVHFEVTDDLASNEPFHYFNCKSFQWNLWDTPATLFKVSSTRSQL